MTQSGETLSIKVYKNCYALPHRDFKSEDGVQLRGGGLCCDGVWIRESGLFIGSLAPYEFNSEETQYVDEDVVFIGCMSTVWGHAITDCLKHLWWLRTEEYKSKHQWKRLVYWGPEPLDGVFLELIKMADVDVSRLLFIDRPMSFRSVIVPDVSFNYTEGWASKDYLDTIELITSNSHPYHVKGVEKLFLSERESRRLWGVKSIEKIARSAGYKVYYPGEHSLRDQISVLRSASEVLSFESSVGHNSVFCLPRIKLTILRKASYANRYQPIINQLREFDVATLDASLSIMNDKRYPYAGPFFVYPNRAVCEAIIPTSFDIGNKHGLFPFKVFKQYIEYNLWSSEDALSHKLVFSDEQAKCIAQEITQYREQKYKRISNVFKFVPLPRIIKGRIVMKISKYLVRHLI